VSSVDNNKKQGTTNHGHYRWAFTVLCWPVVAEVEGVSPLPLPVPLFLSDIGRVRPGHHQMAGVLLKDHLSQPSACVDGFNQYYRCSNIPQQCSSRATIDLSPPLLAACVTPTRRATTLNLADTPGNTITKHLQPLCRVSSVDNNMKQGHDKGGVGLRIGHGGLRSGVRRQHAQQIAVACCTAEGGCAAHGVGCTSRARCTAVISIDLAVWN